MLANACSCELLTALALANDGALASSAGSLCAGRAWLASCWRPSPAGSTHTFTTLSTNEEDSVQATCVGTRGWCSISSSDQVQPRVLGQLTTAAELKP